MRQFVVPQFIDVEVKVLGPINVRQFVIMLAAVLIDALIYSFVDMGLFILISVFILGIAAVFAFAKVNGRPIHYFLLNFLQTSVSTKIRVWYKDAKILKKESKQKKKEKKEGQAPPRPQLTGSRLSQLSLIVDTGGRYQGNLK